MAMAELPMNYMADPNKATEHNGMQQQQKSGPMALDQKVNATISETKLIVNYMPQSMTDAEFKTMFQNIGQLASSKIIRDHMTGVSCCYGFIEYINPTDARTACTALNGIQLETKNLKVAFARASNNRGSNLYIKNLPPDTTAELLDSAFSLYGTILQSRVLVDNNTGNAKGVGFVLFENETQSSDAILSLNDRPMPGSQYQHSLLQVKLAEDNKNKIRQNIQAQLGVGPPGYPPAGGGFGSRNPSFGYPSMGYGSQPSPYGAPDPSDIGDSQGGYQRGSYAPGPMRSQAQGKYRYNPMNGVSSPAGGVPPSVYPDGTSTFALFVVNLDPDVDDSTLWQLFGPYGAVSTVRIVREPDTQKSKGFAFVNYFGYDDAVKAINGINGYTLRGKTLKVAFKTPKSA